jgi:trans-2,3-dihydro-3-hydroxyanthranilate isomerase
MQALARETNFSETTFILSETPRDGGYDVRIFTPGGEIPFAGHPTLGTAFVLREHVLRQPVEAIVLNLKIGRVPVKFEPESGLLWMKPGEPVFGSVCDAAGFAALAGLAAADIDVRFPVEEVSLGVPFTFIPVRTLEALERARFRWEQYDKMAGMKLNPCLYLFCRETRSPANQICARMFAETFGIREDPATGSAAACLAGYILRHRYLDGGRVDVRVEQGHSVGRPSLLFVRAEARSGKTEIAVGGHVILAASGELV